MPCPQPCPTPPDQCSILRVPTISLPAVSRRTTAFNMYVSNTGSIDVPPSWALALYNPAYTGAEGSWNMQVSPYYRYEEPA